MAKCSHESCLPLRVRKVIPTLDEVTKNSVPAIRSKEFSYPIRKSKFDMYMSYINVVSELIKSSLFLHPSTWTSRGYVIAPPTSAVFC
jgi:hypothetical protein